MFDNKTLQISLFEYNESSNIILNEIDKLYFGNNKWLYIYFSYILQLYFMSVSFNAPLVQYKNNITYYLKGVLIFNLIKEYSKIFPFYFQYFAFQIPLFSLILHVFIFIFITGDAPVKSFPASIFF